jgi:non-lysosomal glucosylceramidase
MRKGARRRDFLKTVAAAGLAEPLAAGPQSNSAAAPEPGYPRVYTGRQLARIAFPLGGIGAGSISLGGRGQFRDWEIFNRPGKGHSPEYAFAAIRAQRAGGRPVARVIEARIAPPYEGASGLGSANVPGLPRLESAAFTGEFPMARIDFTDSTLPVKVSLEAFTPFIPLDAEASGLPVAILRYRVENPAASEAAVSIAFSLSNPCGAEGRTNSYRVRNGTHGLFMTNPFLSATDPLAGSFTLMTSAREGKVTGLQGWRGGTGWRVGPLLFWDDFTADGELGPEAAVHDAVGSLCLAQTVPAGGHRDYTFILAWHFPNRTPQRSGWSAPKGDEQTVIGNHYCAGADSWGHAAYALGNLDKLEARTRAFVSAMRRSTLPAAVREGAMANLSTLVTPTSFRTADGAFHGFEGCNDASGCCFGSCTHVWNYEVATTFLFPSLARSLRETSFGFSTDEQGRMDFREKLPYGKEHFGVAAADGQMGQIVHLYLDWKLSGDDAWLRKLWPAAKRALEFAWIPGGWDADRDGVMEGVQHNTYDVEFYGPNPLCGIWYLAALRAGEEMARALGDASAAEYRRLFESGSRSIDANLFNGEYYIQKVQGRPRDSIAPGLMAGMGSANTEKPEFQAGDGCLVDQLLGQYLAGIAGLGDLLDRDHIARALASIYKYNYKRSLYEHESVQRVYALNDEAALVICDYGRGTRPQIPFPYFAEVMTGFEYAAAVLMMARGMAPQGIELIGNIRRRYDGERRNPWDEAECGHHYARAMASWAAIPTLAGFHYDAPARKLAVAPLIQPDRFSCFWSTASGWGEFEHAAAFRLRVEEGSLAIRSLTLALPAVTAVRHAGALVSHTAAAGTIRLDREIVVKPGEELVVA